jgi:hypothetical protein
MLPKGSEETVRHGDQSSENQSQNPIDKDLLSAITGTQADRQRLVCSRVRNVVNTSRGILNEQKEMRCRNRALAGAAVVIFLFLVGPLLWMACEHFSAGGRWCDENGQMGIWLFLWGSALLACALLAGWLKKRS